MPLPRQRLKSAINPPAAEVASGQSNGKREPDQRPQEVAVANKVTPQAGACFLGIHRLTNQLIDDNQAMLAHQPSPCELKAPRLPQLVSKAAMPCCLRPDHKSAGYGVE